MSQQMVSNRNVLALTVSNTIAVTVNGLWIMFMPFYFEKLLGSVEMVGVVFSLAVLTSALFYPIGGRLADRLGRRPLIISGRFIAALGPLVLLFSIPLDSSIARIIMAMFGYILVFIGGSLRLPASSMLLMESSSKRKRGTNYMIAERVLPSIPPAITVFVGAYLYVSGEAPIMFLIGGYGLIISGLFLLPLRESHSSDITVTEPKTARGLPKVEMFILILALAFVLDGVSAQSLSWYVPIFLGETNAILYGVMISVSTLVIAGFALLSGVLVDRIGIKYSLIPGWIALAVTVFLFGLVTSPVYSLFLYCVWVALDTVDTAIPPLLISEKYPKDERATRMGWFNMLVRGSLFLGPILTSLLLSISPQMPFFAKSIMNLLAALVVLRLLTTSSDNIDRSL
ncbi:MAG: MFS transporter [Candidatus Thorarchaeota archaeon]